MGKTFKWKWMIAALIVFLLQGLPISHASEKEEIRHRTNIQKIWEAVQEEEDFAYLKLTPEKFQYYGDMSLFDYDYYDLFTLIEKNPVIIFNTTTWTGIPTPACPFTITKPPEKCLPTPWTTATCTSFLAKNFYMPPLYPPAEKENMW